ncbi:hypothetical protein HSX10_10910 [Winogradskyella undariae]|uniref:hypothetical protein n=1 Tax=Winogradskyella undariae TaxID=1285465 RepID=UPI00156AD8F8|nr:hypothetical protein [Winogradskyella undariae]NRR92076.1 hypothetical protein [Winogradskyella undariae]
MKNNLLYVIVFLSCFLGFSQQKITWEDLSKVDYEDRFFPIYEEYYKYPTFLPSVKALAGKQIEITGYFLNIAPEDGVYILSKTPMSSCFFCGQGEPDTVIELQFKEVPNFKTDAVVVMTGKLVLNRKDVDHFIFILEDSKGELVD